MALIDVLNNPTFYVPLSLNIAKEAISSLFKGFGNKPKLPQSQTINNYYNCNLTIINGEHHIHSTNKTKALKPRKRKSPTPKASKKQKKTNG